MLFHVATKHLDFALIWASELYIETPLIFEVVVTLTHLEDGLTAMFPVGAVHL